LLSGTVQN